MSKNKSIAMVSPSSSSDRKIFINVFKGNETSMVAFVNEVKDGKVIPGLISYLSKNDQGMLEISAPIRRKDGEKYLFKPKKNSKGDYISSGGEVVSMLEAADEYDFVTDIDGRTKYATLASLNFVNEKKPVGDAEAEKTKSTYILAKFYSDEEMYESGKRTFLLKSETDPEKISQLKNELNDIKVNGGQFMRMFVSEGHEHFQKLGFEVRPSKSYQSENDMVY